LLVYVIVEVEEAGSWTVSNVLARLAVLEEVAEQRLSGLGPLARIEC